MGFAALFLSSFALLLLCRFYGIGTGFEAMVPFHSRPTWLFTGPSARRNLCYNWKKGQLSGLRQRNVVFTVCATAKAPTTNVWSKASKQPVNTLPRSLVIVESPSKAKKISEYLKSINDREYVVECCMGHVRDLPKTKTESPKEFRSLPIPGIDVVNDFSPVYIVPKNRVAIIENLKLKMDRANEVILATDEDREGEAIAWHLTEILKPDIPIRRAIFNEITQAAIFEAFHNTRDIDMPLVHAQTARRLLDRELKRLSFTTARFFGASAMFRVEGDELELCAQLRMVGGKRVAIGKDFGGDGQLTASSEKGVAWLRRDEANSIVAKAIVCPKWTVVSVDKRKSTRSPPLPFTTSTFIQEISRSFDMTSGAAMSCAQRLYEAGLITYMRTDSPTLSHEAETIARALVNQKYSECAIGYIGTDHNKSVKKNKKRTANKFRQEAHEAIRPSVSSDKFEEVSSINFDLLPSSSAFKKDNLRRVYDRVYRRTIGSVMRPSLTEYTAADIQGTLDDGREVIFTAASRRILEPGWQLAYDAQDPQSNEEDSKSEAVLVSSSVGKGTSLKLMNGTIEEHSTYPPNRYTEASFVSEMDARGIGRPSTYTPVLEKLKSKYLTTNNSRKALIPNAVSFAVTRMLMEHSPGDINSDFTAQMEGRLDSVAKGDGNWVDYLSDYYLGPEGLRERVKHLMESVDVNSCKRVILPQLKEAGDSLKLSVGYYGTYVSEDNCNRMIRVPTAFENDVSKISVEYLKELLERGSSPSSIGFDPVSQKEVFVHNGRFGPFYTRGDETATALTQDMKFEDVCRWMDLHNAWWVHPETKTPFWISTGPFGVHIKHDGCNYGLNGFSTEGVLALDESSTLALLNKRRENNRRICDLGTYGGHRVEIYLKRQKRYVLTWARQKVYLPKGFDLSSDDTFGLTEAIHLIKDANHGILEKGMKLPSTLGEPELHRAIDRMRSRLRKLGLPFEDITTSHEGQARLDAVPLPYLLEEAMKNVKPPIRKLSARSFFMKESNDNSPRTVSMWKELSKSERQRYDQLSSEDGVTVKAKKLYHWYGGWEHGCEFPMVDETGMKLQHNEELSSSCPPLRIERAENAGITKKKAKIKMGGSKKRHKSAYVHFLEHCMREKDKKRKASDVMKTAAELWNGMDEAEREPWYTIATLGKAEDGEETAGTTTSPPS